MLLPHCITMLVGLKSYGNLVQIEVILTSTEMEEVEDASRTLLEAPSRKDWWLDSMKKLTLKTVRDALL